MKGLIDVHVHLAALPTAANGCVLSTKMKRSMLAKLIAYVQGLPLDDAETANRLYLRRLREELEGSQAVSGAVLLGMDGVYDASGELDLSHTDFLIANDCVFEACRTDPRLKPGVSINPRRKDALEEVDRCAEKGAALVKVLPNAQVFDPSEARFKAFYRKLAERGLPLLSHIGYEFSLFGHDQSVGDPDRLVPALEEGVTVIAAHGCSNGAFFYEKHFPMMRDLVKRFPNFYMDLSALTLPNRVGALLKLRRSPELSERLLFGTDYPLPCFAYPALAGAPGGYRRAAAAGNRFDRQFRVLEALGVVPGADAGKLLRARP